MRLPSLIKSNHATLVTALALGDGPHSICGVYFSLNLNKSTSYLSLCLSLNSLCDGILGFDWVWVPATWVRVPSRVLAGFEPQHMGLSGECMLLGSVSSQQRFGAMDIKAFGASQLSGLGQTVL